MNFFQKIEIKKIYKNFVRWSIAILSFLCCLGVAISYGYVWGYGTAELNSDKTIILMQEELISCKKILNTPCVFLAVPKSILKEEKSI